MPYGLFARKKRHVLIRPYVKDINKTREVKHVMTSKIVSVSSGDTVRGVCDVMAEKNISCVVVKAGESPYGIITERDILRRIVSAGLEPSNVRAEEIMSKPLITVDAGLDLLEALQIMRARKVRRVVVTSKKHLEGLITQTDIINALSGILLEKLGQIQHLYDDSQRLFKDSIKALFHTLDAKDHYTGTHSQKVARLAQAICNEMGLPEKERRTVYLAGLFHDIGKIHISDKVLNKKGPLDKEEYEEIKKHPGKSEDILKPVTEFRDVLSIIRHHHEWHSGEGYPDGIKGEKIPLGARIISVVDSYNAMRTDRPYRKALSRKEAIDVIKKMSGRQFDPHIARIFLRMLARRPHF